MWGGAGFPPISEHSPTLKAAGMQPVPCQSLPQICSAGDGHAFTSALRQLYMAVTLQEAKQARKRHHPADLLPGAEAPATCGQGQAKEGKRALQLKGCCCCPEGL
ncbi:uncharacterized protein LOC104911683 isoform X3 [Meleagris gallopavo]|uniref:uncharacterized protein LOC104911683 isoform X3 n=1 Tax=Meleagris gallopavo TaxID=9103 RepID=UPI00093D1AF5|nr:uncharacterized protein LOC104911683 isoform X3 [Meleagris gallopavo]